MAGKPQLKIIEAGAAQEGAISANQVPVVPTNLKLVTREFEERIKRTTTELVQENTNGATALDENEAATLPQITSPTELMHFGGKENIQGHKNDRDRQKEREISTLNRFRNEIKLLESVQGILNFILIVDSQTSNDIGREEAKLREKISCFIQSLLTYGKLRNQKLSNEYKIPDLELINRCEEEIKNLLIESKKNDTEEILRNIQILYRMEDIICEASPNNLIKDAILRGQKNIQNHIESLHTSIHEKTFPLIEEAFIQILTDSRTNTILDQYLGYLRVEDRGLFFQTIEKLKGSTRTDIQAYAQSAEKRFDFTEKVAGVTPLSVIFYLLQGIDQNVELNDERKSLLNVLSQYAFIDDRIEGEDIYAWLKTLEPGAKIKLRTFCIDMVTRALQIMSEENRPSPPVQENLSNEINEKQEDSIKEYFRRKLASVIFQIIGDHQPQTVTQLDVTLEDVNSVIHKLIDDKKVRPRVSRRLLNTIIKDGLGKTGFHGSLKRNGNYLRSKKAEATAALEDYLKSFKILEEMKQNQ